MYCSINKCPLVLYSVSLLAMQLPAEGQEAEYECLSACGSSSSILRVEETVGGCCGGSSPAGAFNIPGAGNAIECQECEDYRSKLL